MREHPNSCTKQPLKDNKMTSIYSVYHGHRPNRASANADARFGCQQTCQQTTTSFLNHHHHHPQRPPMTPTHDTHPSSPHHCHHPPPTTTWTRRYTIQTMQEHHVSRRQVNGRRWWWRGMSMDVWRWQHHVQPQVSTSSPSLQSKPTPPPTFFADREARCHVAVSNVATKY